MKKGIIIGVILSFVLLILTFSACGKISDNKEKQSGTTAGNALSRDGYKLDRVVILSRHNIRSPLSDKGSVLDTMTPNEWFSWSSDPSDLSLRGGTLETEMGQYFRKWLETEGLFPEDYRPDPEEVRIYANSKQRTIATAGFFKAGLLPVSNSAVEYHSDFDTMDPVFNPQLTFVSESYREDADKEIQELFGDTIKGLDDNYKLLSEVIDVHESEDWKTGKFTGFRTDDTVISLEENAEPSMTGSLKTACSISDALVLQYYEADDSAAAFGRKLTDEEWEKIAEIKDVYGDVLFTAPDIAVNVAHPLLKEIDSELDTAGRRFTFLCGHDSNIASVLASLKAEEYDLPGAIEKRTPIGSKLVFCRWSDDSGKSYISLDLVYQSVDQLRDLTILDLKNPPEAVSIKLEGLSQNGDGLYEEDEFRQRLKDAINAYYDLEEKYSLAEAA